MASFVSYRRMDFGVVFQAITQQPSSLTRSQELQQERSTSSDLARELTIKSSLLMEADRYIVGGLFSRPTSRVKNESPAQPCHATAPMAPRYHAHAWVGHD